MMDNTIEEIIPRKRGINAYNILTLIFVGLGSMSYGYTSSIIGTTLGQPSFYEYFDLNTRPDATDLISSMNGIFQAGGVIGTLILPYFADRFGRKWAIAIPAILCIISGALLAGSVHVAMFIVFRFVAGAGAFMILAAVPIWMNEVVPEHLRGGLVDIHGVCILWGYFAQGWVGYGFFFWTGGGLTTWRVPIVLQCAWPLFLVCGLYWVPESPRWLIMQDRHDEAKIVLERLHASGADREHLYARREFLQIQKQIVIDRLLPTSWVQIFKKPSYRKRAVLAVSTTGIIQCSGVLVINNYGPTLYKNLGFSPQLQLLYPAGWLTFALACNIFGCLFIDRFPRPKFLSLGILGCMACLIVEAALVANFVPSTNHDGLRGAVAMFFVFQIFYGAMLDGTQFVYLGELFPNHIRAKGICLGVAMISLMNIMWLQAAPTAFQNIGWKFYLPFIIPGTLGGIAMWLWWPETRGVPLEEIAAIFGDADEVAIYKRDIDINTIVNDKQTETVAMEHEGKESLEEKESV